MMNLPLLTPKERLARQHAKRQRLLQFLGTETWTSHKVACRVLSVSAREGARTLHTMVRDSLLTQEAIETGPRSTITLFGITPTGITACRDIPVSANEHQVGRVSAANLTHNLLLQEIRLVAEAAGWSAWIPGRQLYNKGLPVVPDAVVTDPAGVRVALELERNVKSRKRSSEVIAGHLLAIAQQKAWARVLYITDHRCDADRLRELYMSVKEVATPNGKAPLTDAHRARFTFINLSDFRG